MKNVKVNIKGQYVFTPDTKEEHDKAVVMQFTDEQANKLIDGFGIDVRDIPDVNLPDASDSPNISTGRHNDNDLIVKIGDKSLIMTVEQAKIIKDQLEWIIPQMEVISVKKSIKT